jgi:hypothetical protein
MIRSGGAHLAIVVLSAVLFLFMMFNWRSIYDLLFEREQKSIPLSISLSAMITRIKVTLLYFTGATRLEVSGKCTNYLGALRLQETYFAQNKLRCTWQLFSYYMLYCFILVFLTRPIDVERSKAAGHLVSHIIGRDALAQLLNLSMLCITNVSTDLMSLAITFVLLNKMSEAFLRKDFLSAIVISIFDLALSFMLFSFSQLVSNILYPRAIENAPADYTPLSVQSAFMPYAFVKSMNGDSSTFYDFTFPGQLFITGTVFIPTLISMAVIILFLLMAAAGHYIRRAQNALFGVEMAADGLGPAPIAGGASSSAVLRSDRCFHFAVNFMLGTIQATTAAVLGAAIIYLFALA